MKIRFITLGFLLLVAFGCQKSKFDIVNNKLDSITNLLERSPKDKLLNFLDENLDSISYNNDFIVSKNFNNGKFFFTLNLKNPEPQIIHISSDSNSIPYMVLCKVEGRDNGEIFIIDRMQLAIRSIGTRPHSFFKIAEVPTFKILNKDIDKPTNNNEYRGKLNINIDLNRSSQYFGQVGLAANNNTIRNRDLIEIHIKPEALKKSLKEELNKNPNFSFDENLIDNFCCDGVICSIEVVVPRP